MVYSSDYHIGSYYQHETYQILKEVYRRGKAVLHVNKTYPVYIRIDYIACLVDLGIVKIEYLVEARIEYTAEV